MTEARQHQPLPVVRHPQTAAFISQRRIPLAWFQVARNSFGSVAILFLVHEKIWLPTEILIFGSVAPPFPQAPNIRQMRGDGLEPPEVVQSAGRRSQLARQMYPEIRRIIGELLLEQAMLPSFSLPVSKALARERECQ